MIFSVGAFSHESPKVAKDPKEVLNHVAASTQGVRTGLQVPSLSSCVSQ